MYKIHQQVKARQDLKNIWLYTYENFGVDQADKYFDELEFGMKAIRNNPLIGVSCDYIRSLAENLGVAASTLARVVAERSAVSPEMALRLLKALGRSPECWLSMQDNYDLWQAKKSANLSNVQKIRFAANA